MAAIDIVIRYSVERGFEDEALILARRLFAVLDESIDSLTLTPVEDGEFDVQVNGHLVYDHAQCRRPPRLSDVLDILPSAGPPICDAPRDQSTQ